MAKVQLGKLVEAARAGDRDAFATLVRCYENFAIGLAYARLGDSELARDAAQDAFIEAFLHLSQLRDPQAFPSWMRRIVAKHCDRIARRKIRSTEELAFSVDPPADPLAPEMLIERRRRQVIARGAIAVLPEHERTVVALYYFASQSLVQISSFLEISTNTVKQRLHSARQRMSKGIMNMVGNELCAGRRISEGELPDAVRLFLAIRAGDLSAVNEVLDRNRELLEAEEDWDPTAFADIDLPMPTRATPLVRAAACGDVRIIDALIDRGARVDQQCGCNAHERPLWAAIVSGREAAASRLLKRGADPNATGAAHHTPLHVATMRNRADLVRLLMEHGASREVRDRDGRTAADWARVKHFDELVSLLDEKPTSSVSPDKLAAEKAGNFFHTGIKALDLFAPIEIGGVIRVDGPTNAGRLVALSELAAVVGRRPGMACLWVWWESEAWSDREFDHLLKETDIQNYVQVIKGEFHDSDGGRTVAQRALSKSNELLDHYQHIFLTFLEQPGFAADIETMLPQLRTLRPGAITTFVVRRLQTNTRPAPLRPPFGGLIAFDPVLAQSGMFPAIDPLGSASRLLEGGGFGARHRKLAHDARELLGRYRKVFPDLKADIALELDDATRLACRRGRLLQAFLTQPFHVTEPFTGKLGTTVSYKDLLDGVETILSGQADILRAKDVFFRGSLGLHESPAESEPGSGTTRSAIDEPHELLINSNPADHNRTH
jgi:RNA polymerase sigma factor (sigma-70 family)